MFIDNLDLEIQEVISEESQMIRERDEPRSDGLHTFVLDRTLSGMGDPYLPPLTSPGNELEVAGLRAMQLLDTFISSLEPQLTIPERLLRVLGRIQIRHEAITPPTVVRGANVWTNARNWVVQQRTVTIDFYTPPPPMNWRREVGEGNVSPFGTTCHSSEWNPQSKPKPYDPPGTKFECGICYEGKESLVPVGCKNCTQQVICLTCLHEVDKCPYCNISFRNKSCWEEDVDNEGPGMLFM